MGGLVKGIFGGGDAAEDAARIQAGASTEAIREQRRQFDISQEQFEPFREAGVRALTSQEALLGLAGTEAQQEAFQAFTDSPGQAFLRQRGEQSLLRNQAAIGGLGGGRVREALQQQGIGVAQQDLQNQLARLSGLSGGGQVATQNVAQLGAQTSANIGGLLGQAGQAQAGGVLGAQQAQSQLGGQFLGAGLGAAAGGGLLGTGAATAFGGSAGAGALLGLLSDVTMKEDIYDLDLEQCFDTVLSLPLKSWRYLESTGLDRGVHLGPMAQDAPDCIKVEGHEMLDLHSELMLIAGAIQYMKQEGLLNAH